VGFFQAIDLEAGDVVGGTPNHDPHRPTLGRETNAISDDAMVSATTRGFEIDGRTAASAAANNEEALGFVNH
jgi:hypothetical protein